MLIVNKPGVGCKMFFFFVVMMLITLCTAREPPKTRTPPVDIYDLLMDVSDFPQEGWNQGVGPAPKPERERGEAEAIYAEFWHASFERGIGGTWHDVYRYRNEVEAGANFLRHGFLNRHIITSWSRPKQWSYDSPIADRYKFACAEVDIFGHSCWTCQVVAQYDEYISVFHTRLSQDYMTLEDLERILVAIDERMVLYLVKEMG